MADADAPACSYPPRPKAAAAPAAPAPAAEAHKTAFAATSLAEVKDGRFVRTASVYRNKIEKGGEFPPAAGRYHLYVSLACPWAHRVVIFRKLKGLEKAISMSVVYPIWGEAEPGIKGWVFEKEGKNSDQVAHLHSLRLVYKHFNPAHEGKATTPLLVDTKTNRIVNNESSELVVFLNNEFNEFAEHPEVNLLPADLKTKIEEVDKYMYESINNGVYRCGFATSQAAYEEAFQQLFEALDHMEALLAKQRFLVSNTLVTEADVRLFVTLIRFDAVYVTHFKTNKKRIADYPNLLGFVRDVYQHKGVGETVDFWHIKNHYFGSHPGINPHLIVPLGPDLPDYNAPSGRAHFSA